ncbi:GntR family transcriptional regulator [Rhodococcus ruber BKS 20-38]|uniref:GntR family transcriptional regulator n=1 Tax=Rhodococcus ruber BKS 20-38 TaxID=1278076 RepID=M2YZ02_9NOCA|nr:GntR family transcriptional regulator [Rhodococcus ruber BKS 20-38]
MSAQLAVELDRSSPVPLYFQLAQAIEKAILGGDLAPGDRFENELALAQRLNLSRPTTRRAIQELVDKGLLVRKRGVGTQVVQSPVHRPVELTSLFDDLARAGQTPTTKLLEYRVGPPDDEVAFELNLGPDAEGVSIRRLRCTNGEPLAIMANPASRIPGRPSRRRGRVRTQPRPGRGGRLDPSAAVHQRGTVGDHGQPPPGRARAGGRGTRGSRPLPVAAGPGRAHPPGATAHRRARRHPRGSRAARREDGRTAAHHEPHRVRRFGHRSRVRQPLLPRVALLLRHHRRRPLRSAGRTS